MKQSKSSISTVSGRFYDLLRPEAYEYDIREIAHALSNLCRYTGHTNGFYSVAEHSVLVSRIVPKELALCGLLHDSSEAFLGDVSSPLKALLPAYKEIEERVEAAIAAHFAIPFPYPPEIKAADNRMYWKERQGVADNGVRDEIWHQNYRATRKDIVVRGLSPKMAYRFFMSRYREIMEEAKNGQGAVREGPQAAQA